MQNQRLKLLAITSLVSTLSASCFAQVAKQPTEKIYPVTIAGKKFFVTFCPKPSALVKNPNKLTWSAYGKRWRSYNKSFVTKVKAFIGAQWTGANVGQVTCLYAGQDPLAFPILLRFHTLSTTPQGNGWSKNLGGFYNCKSKQRSLCPIYMIPKPKPVDILKEAEQLQKHRANPGKQP